MAREKGEEQAVFTFRLRRRELEAFNNAARQHKMSSSEYLRACVRQGLRPTAQFGVQMGQPQLGIVYSDLPYWSESANSMTGIRVTRGEDDGA